MNKKLNKKIIFYSLQNSTLKLNKKNCLNRKISLILFGIVA